MAKEQKFKNCLNCKQEVLVHAKFCNHCGQKVDKNKFHLRILLGEFFDNYVSMDSRLGRSIYPFLFQPGKLTIAFNEGRRKHYSNPFRLYLIVSIFFFFAINRFVVQNIENSNANTGNYVPIALKAFEEIPEPQHRILQENLSDAIVESLNDSSKTSFKDAFEALTPYRKKQLTILMHDSLQAKLGIPEDTAFADYSPNITFGFGDGNGFGVTVSDINYKIINKYKYDNQVTDAQIVDSLNLGELSERERFFYERSIRSMRNDSRVNNQIIFKNMSFAMFILMPLSALLLMLFTFRRVRYYVEHLIHAVHLHTFAFLIIGFILFVFSLVDVPDTPSAITLLAVNLILFIYLFKSCRRVYGFSFWGNLLFVLILSFLYFIFAIVIIMAEATLSFFYLL